MPESEPLVERRTKRWWAQPDMIVALMAGVASVGALLVGSYTAYLQRHHDRAEVWPHLELSISFSPQGAAVSVVNSGIGPAVIQSVGATVDGRPVLSWEQIAQTFVSHPLRAYSTSSISDRVVRAGESLEILTVPAAELSDSSRNALSRSSISICYASVFDERWVVDVPTLVSRASWRTEERCRPNPANSRL